MWPYCVKLTLILAFEKRVFDQELTGIIIIVSGRPGGGGVLPYMGYIGTCRCEGYGFQAVYSSIGYINQSVWT